METLSVENLNFSYPLHQTPAVRNVSFRLRQGDFVVLYGANGCGKSTLLRLLKPELIPLGDKSGTVRYDGVPQESLTPGQSASGIGFVMQRPEQQIVTDRVWHELAFGLENLGFPKEIIAARVAETACYFGIEHWYDKNTSELSGGQKQILSLASVMVMQPKILILDEPTSQLDPIAASDFLQTLHRLNQDFSLTILIAEHRMEEVLPYADRLIIMENGGILHDGNPKSVVSALENKPNLLAGMPAASRLFHQLHASGECPITVREGRKLIQQFHTRFVQPDRTSAFHSSKTALEMKNVFLRYEREGNDILSGLNLTVREGEIVCILGGNGSGKTTALCAMAGLQRFYSGSIRIFGKPISSYRNQSLYRECVAVLPQDVQMLFLCNSVKEELKEAGCNPETLPFDLSALLEQHPYDVSGGEQQLLGLAKVLANKPRLLLLDEPAKGLEASARKKLTEILQNLRSGGMTIVIVTHDAEFAAETADRCALFFRGNIVSQGEPEQFFSENHYYTTAVSSITRGIYQRTVRLADAAALCRKNGRKGACPDAEQEG